MPLREVRLTEARRSPKRHYESVTITAPEGGFHIIYKKAKLLRKFTKGKISIPSLIKYLEKQGYSVVFFNTPEGNELLTLYGIEPGNARAFTYRGTTNVIFVDNTICTSDKLYSLLHECAHIVLGHIGSGEIEFIDKRAAENEAEAFAYFVMNYSAIRRKTVVRTLIASVALAAVLFLSSSLLTKARHSNSKGVYTPLSNDEIVYISETGAKYHRPSCRYAVDYNSSALTKSEAMKTHTPCSVCNP